MYVHFFSQNHSTISLFFQRCIPLTSQERENGESIRSVSSKRNGIIDNSFYKETQDNEEDQDDAVRSTSTTNIPKVPDADSELVKPELFTQPVKNDKNQLMLAEQEGLIYILVTLGCWETNSQKKCKAIGLLKEVKTAGIVIQNSRIQV